MDLREIEWDGADWVVVAQVRDQRSFCEHSNEPSGSIKCWEVRGFSKRAQL
jgi:hypothetical protein